MTIKATSKNGQAVSASVAVDANSNTITALLNTTTPVVLQVVVQSLHPDTPFTYSGGFGGREYSNARSTVLLGCLCFVLN